MKFLILFAVLTLAAAQDSYPTKYDSIDVDEILKSDRLFKNYYNCLMDAGPCTPEGTELKKYLPDALANDCSKCTEKQRTTGDKVITFLVQNHPAEWTALKAKFDPDNKVVEKYRDIAAKQGVTL